MCFLKVLSLLILLIGALVRVIRPIWRQYFGNKDQMEEKVE